MWHQRQPEPGQMCRVWGLHSEFGFHQESTTNGFKCVCVDRRGEKVSLRCLRNGVWLYKRKVAGECHLYAHRTLH